MIFKVEAAERLNAIGAALLAIERSATPHAEQARLDDIRREVHSLKGASRAVNLEDIEGICQPLEGALQRVKTGELPASTALFDLLHRFPCVLRGVGTAILAAEAVG